MECSDVVSRLHGHCFSPKEAFSMQSLLKNRKRKVVLRELPHALVCGLLPWLPCACPKKCMPFRCSKPACVLVCVTEACPGQMALAGVSAAMVAEPSLRALGLWKVSWQFLAERSCQLFGKILLRSEHRPGGVLWWGLKSTLKRLEGTGRFCK